MPVALLAAAVMTCLHGAAFAATVPMESNGRVATIGTADLNLNSPAHQAQLDARIQRAARQVCAPDSYRDLRSLSASNQCEQAAIASASTKRDSLVARAQSEQMASRVVAQPGTSN